MVTRPNTFIIGAPKCATTSLVEALREHPQVFVPFVKEPGFFGSDIGSEVGGMDDYLALYAPAPERTQVAIDGTTHYLASADAVEHILAFEPNTKFICSFRDPLDVAPAFHSQLRRHHVEPLASFDAAWADQPARRHRMTAGGRREPLYAELCIFGRQLERLYERVPRDRVFVILFRDLVSEPKRVLSDLQPFLGLEPADLGLPRSNENQIVVHEGMHRVKMRMSQPARRLKQRLGLHHNLGIMRTLFAFTSRPGERSRPCAETVEAMKQALADDMELFERIAGKSVRRGFWACSGERRQLV